MNGVEVASATSGDTLNGTLAYADLIYIGAAAGYYSYTVTIDDVYISSGNTFLGDVRVDTLYPTSDGNDAQFTCSTGSTHYALVDEATPNTTDYVESATAGQRDSYGLTDLTAIASQTILGVQVNAAVVKSDAGFRSMSTMVRSGSTNSDGATVSLPSSQTYVSQIYETDPATSAAWTESGVNAMEAGMRIVE